MAPSTFGSQHVQNTPILGKFSDHFWQLRCWKSARRCGAKIPLWFHGLLGGSSLVTTNEVSVFLSWNRGPTTLHYTTLHSTTLHYTPLHSTTPQRQLELQLRYFTLHCTRLDYTTLPYITLPPQMQLQLHYTNYTTTQLQLHYTTTTTTAALHHTTSSSCGWGDRPCDHCNHCSHFTKHNSNHLSVHQWIRSAICDSQQPSSPI